MARVQATDRFRKAYKRLPDDVRERVDDALRKFIDNPRHPSLHFEKLRGSNYRTIRPDRGKYLIVLRDQEQRCDQDNVLYELVDVDRHSVVDRKYG